MEALHKLENMIIGWAKNVPHLPVAGQKWLAQNIWWLVLIAAIIGGIVSIFGLFGLLLGGAVASFVYVINPSIAAIILISTIIGLGFTVLRTVLFGLAVQPLRAGEKKGWVLLFLNWLVYVLDIVVSAIFSLLTFSMFGFFGAVIFGAIGLAISGYFLFEMHGQFAHVVHAKKVTHKKSA